MQNFSIKYLQTVFKNTAKRIIHHDQAGFLPGMQRWFDIHRSINVINRLTIPGFKLCYRATVVKRS